MSSVKIVGPCALCDSIKGAKIFSSEEVTEHVKFHFLQAKIIHDEITMEGTLAKCFPEPIQEQAVVNPKEMSHQSLLDLCQSLFGNRPPSDTFRVTCMSCNAILNEKRFTSKTLICHARSHLGQKMYECCHCDASFTTMYGTKTHLRQAHSIEPPSKDDLRDNSGKFNGELYKMIEQCFPPNEHSVMEEGGTMGGAKGRARSRCGKSVPKGRQNLVRLCHSLLDKKAAVKKTVCDVCGIGLILYDKQTGSVRVKGVINHARSHLGFNTFECAHCDGKFTSRFSALYHVRRYHDREPTDVDYRDTSELYSTQIAEMVKRCFSGTKREASSKEKAMTACSELIIRNRTKGSKHVAEQRLLSFQLFVKYATRDQRLLCRLCCEQSGGRRPKESLVEKPSALDHACKHLKKPLYRCKICSIFRPTQSLIKHHVVYRHKVSVIKNFDSFVDLFHSDIMAMLVKCYDRGSGGPIALQQATDEATPSDQSSDSRREEILSMASTASSMEHLAYQTKKINGECIVRGPKVDSDIAKERQAYCHRLLRKVDLDSDGKVQCRLCPIRVLCKGRTGLAGKRAIDHAAAHLHKPVYQCNACAQQFESYNTVSMHLRGKHKLKTAKNYECFYDKYQSELTDMLAQCYDKDTPIVQQSATTNRREVATGSARAAYGSKVTGEVPAARERQIFCHSLLRKHLDTEGKIRCRSCHSRISCKDRNGLIAKRAVDHAASHIRMPVFVCNACAQPCESYHKMAMHLRGKHKLKTANNYECFYEKYHSEIMTMLAKCFDD